MLGEKGGAYVDLDFAVPFAQGFLLLRGDVLVAEEDDAALCDEEAEFVFLLGG